MPTATSFLFHLFTEAGVEPSQITEGMNGDYLVTNHDAFISALKNTSLEYEPYAKSPKETYIQVKFVDTKFYIICHKHLDEEKNEELQYFYDRMAGLI